MLILVWKSLRSLFFLKFTLFRPFQEYFRRENYFVIFFFLIHNSLTLVFSLSVFFNTHKQIQHSHIHVHTRTHTYAHAYINIPYIHIYITPLKIKRVIQKKSCYIFACTLKSSETCLVAAHVVQPSPNKRRLVFG